MPPKVQSISSKRKAKAATESANAAKKAKGEAGPITPPDTVSTVKVGISATPKKGVMTLSGAPPTSDYKVYINSKAKELFEQVTVCL
jgi:hypothetical protein